MRPASAGRAFVELGVSDLLTKGLQAAQTRLEAFGAGVRAVGAGLMKVGLTGLGPAILSIRNFASAGDALDEMATRTGMAVESLSALGYAADLAGVDAGTLEGGIRKMQNAIIDAGKGNEGLQASFAALGTSAEQLAGLSPEQQFAAIADGLAGVDDPARKAALAMDILGKSGAAMLPLMAEGSEGIRQATSEAERLGLVMSGDSAKSAARLSDAMDNLWKTLTRLSQVVGEALAEDVAALATSITSVVVTVIRWVQQNAALVATVGKVFAAIAGVGAVLFGLGAAISGAAAICGGLATAIGVVGTVLGAIISPIGLAVAAIAGIGGAALYTSETAWSAVEWIGEQFRWLSGEVMSVVRGISDALAAGDIQLAANILWLGLKVAWQAGIAGLNRLWLEGKRFLLTTVHEMWSDVLVIGETVWHGIKVGWIELTSFLASAWASFTSGLALSWETFKNLGQKAWNYVKSLFDEDFDVGAANLAADQALVAAEQRIEGHKNKALGQLETQRRAKHKSEDAEHAGALRAIIDQEDSSIAALDAQTQAKLSGSRAELDAARAELQAALGKAKTEGDAARAAPPVRKGPSDNFTFDPEEAGIATAKKGGSVVGTFGGLNAFQLGAGSEGYLREIARNTKKLVEKKDPKPGPSANPAVFSR